MPYRRQKREPCFLEWLLDVLNRERSPSNAYWIDREAKIFAIRWVHAKSHLWTPECCELFNLWKREGSRTWAKDRSEDAEKRMKTNFRMNLRSQANFVELTKDKNHGRYPVRIFQVNKATAKVAKTSQSKTEMPKYNEQKHFPFNEPCGTSTLEFYPWSNNPTGTMHPITADPSYSNFSNRTSLDCLKFYETNFQDTTKNKSECSLKLLSKVEDVLNNFPPSFPYQDTTMDESTIADFILDLESSSYTNLVTTSTESGFMERSSFSSVWSGEDLQGTGEDILRQTCNDIDFMWSLEQQLSDSVFE